MFGKARECPVGQRKPDLVPEKVSTFVFSEQQSQFASDIKYLPRWSTWEIQDSLLLVLHLAEQFFINKKSRPKYFKKVLF